MVCSREPQQHSHSLTRRVNPSPFASPTSFPRVRGGGKRNRLWRANTYLPVSCWGAANLNRFTGGWAVHSCHFLAQAASNRPFVLLPAPSGCTHSDKSWHSVIFACVYYSHVTNRGHLHSAHVASMPGSTVLIPPAITFTAAPTSLSMLSGRHQGGWPVLSSVRTRKCGGWC